MTLGTLQTNKLGNFLECFMAQDNVHLVGYCLRVGAFLKEGPRSGGMNLSKALPTCAAKQQWLQIY